MSISFSFVPCGTVVLPFALMVLYNYPLSLQDFIDLPEIQVVFMRGNSAARLPGSNPSSTVYYLCDLGKLLCPLYLRFFICNTEIIIVPISQGRFEDE